MLGRISLEDPRFNYSYKGFCSIVNQIIDLISYHVNRNNNYDVRIHDEQVLRLFNELNPKSNADVYDVGNSFLDDFFNGKIDTTYNAHTLANYENLKERHNSLINTLEIKSEIISQYEEAKLELFSGIPYIGVQIRGTDKITEIPEIPIDNIYKHVDNILQESGLGLIYLATDDKKYLDGFINRYGPETIKFNVRNEISHDSTPLHTRPNREKINYEVLSDVYFLKNSEYFCYTYSNVSLLALIMGINNFKRIQNLNIIA